MRQNDVCDNMTCIENGVYGKIEIEMDIKIKGLKHEKVATGSMDNTLRLWNIREGKEIGKLKGHTLPVWSILEIFLRVKH